MRAEKVGSKTVLAQIVQMVAQAQRSRAPMQRMADASPATSSSTVIGIAVADLLRLGPVRAAAELGLRPDQRRRRADHRLPVRARPGDADVDHGRDGQGGDAGRAVPRRRGDREPAPGRHADRRQDRHADRRQAGVRARRRRAGLQPKTRCCAWPPASTRAASIRWPRRSSAPRASAASRSTSRRLRIEHGHRRARHARRQGRSRSATPR